MLKNDVIIYKEGNLIRFEPPDNITKQAICEKLTYTRIINSRPKYWERRDYNKKFDYVPISCYKFVKIGNSQYLVTNAGYLAKIKKCFKEFGFNISIRDLRKDKRKKIGEPQWSQIKGFTLRPGQKEVLEKITKCDRGQICYPTGAGKSFLMGLFCKLYPKANIIITTAFDAVLQQHYARLSQLLPSVGIYNSKKRVIGRRVMCYSAKSLHHAEFDNCDILLADESQELATDKMFEVLAQFRFSRMYAFSANYRDRFDNADFELEGVFGPLLARMEYQEGVDGNLVVPIQVNWRNVILERNPCASVTDDVELQRLGLWQNEARNKLIANDAREFDDETQVLITVKTLEHACYLKKQLPEFTLCYSVGDSNSNNIHKYKKLNLLSADEPEMTPDRLFSIKRDFESGRLKKVIATTVWNRGVDFQDLSVLIRADASSSKIDCTQITGRLSRLGKNSDKGYGVLIDYLDQFDPRLHSKAKRRQQYYASKQWEQFGPDSRPIEIGKRRKTNKSSPTNTNVSRHMPKRLHK